jgi:NhaA family Na+:H+ antiporter
VLIIAAVVALAWSNLPSADLYFQFLKLPIGVSFDGHALMLPFESWVNDGLMALFFLIVGLEIRREITEGQLAGWRKAAAPGLAAFGGMIVPAIIFAALNWSNPAAFRGWAIPVATDIAFALAALNLLGRRIPIGLRVFLTALAILDDLGAIMVIALFYSSGLDLPALAGGAAVLVVLYGLNRAGVNAVGPYMLGGAVLWGCLFHGGIHPTLAGVALAFVVPMGAESTSTAHRLEAGLGGWVTWAVLPLFGFANAGLQLQGVPLSDFVSPLMLGIVLGLVIGKQIGVFGTSLISVRLGLQLPPGLTLAHLYGGAILCGIGFTMSLFIGDLAFHGTALHDEVKLAVFIGSIISALLGVAVLALASTARARAPATPNRT